MAPIQLDLLASPPLSHVVTFTSFPCRFKTNRRDADAYHTHTSRGNSQRTFCERE